MATSPARVTAAPLRRDTSQRVLGGVCAGLANRLGLDPLVMRIVFVAAATAGGAGIALYALAWVAIPAADRDGAPAPRSAALPRRGSVEVAAGAGLLLLSVLLAFRELGIWFSDALVWPLVLVAAGGALLWRQSVSTAEPAEPEPEPAETGAGGGGARAGGDRLAHRARHRAGDHRRAGLPPGHRMRSAPPATWCSRCWWSWWWSA